MAAKNGYFQRNFLPKSHLSLWNGLNIVSYKVGRTYQLNHQKITQPICKNSHQKQWQISWPNHYFWMSCMPNAFWTCFTILPNSIEIFLGLWVLWHTYAVPLENTRGEITTKGRSKSCHSQKNFKGHKSIPLYVWMDRHLLITKSLACIQSGV